MVDNLHPAEEPAPVAALLGGIPAREPSPSKEDSSPERAGARQAAAGVRTGRNAVRRPHSTSGNIGTACFSPTAHDLSLTDSTVVCYGAWLSPAIVRTRCGTSVPILRTTVPDICHAFCLRLILSVLLFPLLLGAQISPPASPAAASGPSPNVDQRIHSSRPNAPDAEHINIQALRQEANGSWRYFRGNVIFETTDMQLKADEVDYNSDTGYVEARGHVHFEHFVRGEKLDCEKAVYNLTDETGQFYTVTGTAPSRVSARPGLLTTQNPFYFQSDWAERLKDHYVLYNGFLTDCVMPDAWWIFRSPRFDIYPGDHAIVHDGWFRLRGIPLFYAPYFYKSLKKEPRKSGFLIPDVGNSSLHGQMIGAGYYWAINRSYDLTYRGIYYTNAGLANHVDFRGKVNDKTTLDVTLFGVKATQANASADQGVRVDVTGRSDLGHGWVAGGVLDYLSSFAFLQQFTQSFNEAVSSETHSVGFLTKHWSDYGFNFVAQRDVNFQSTAPGDTIEIRKLPEAQMIGREHEIDIKEWPVWLSFDSSAGLERRSQPAFQTRQFVDRLDFAPRVTTAFRWHDFELIPSFGVRETSYGSSIPSPGTVTGAESAAELARRYGGPGPAPRWNVSSTPLPGWGTKVSTSSSLGLRTNMSPASTIFRGSCDSTRTTWLRIRTRWSFR